MVQRGEVFLGSDVVKLLCADWSWEGGNRPGRGQDEKTSGTEQQAVHSGAGRRDLWAPSPLFYLAPRYDPSD